MEGPRRPLPVVVVTAATAVFAWWTAGLRPFTWPALGAVGAAGLAAMVFGIRTRAPSTSRRHDPRRALPWGILFVLLAGWEAAAYLQHPRADHPTLSALADQVLDRRPARALAFLLWLVVGADLARR